MERRDRRTNLIVFTNFANELHEDFVDVDALFSGGLEELGSEVLCEVPALCVKPKRKPHGDRKDKGTVRGKRRTIHADLPLVF